MEPDVLPNIGRLILLNENLGGHATMHLNISRALAEHPEIDCTSIDLPPRSISRRIVGLRVPGLSRLDLDLAPVRAQLALSTTARRLLRAEIAQRPIDAIHAYSQHVALRVTSELRAYPSVVSTDGSAAQNAVQLPFRRPGRFTPTTARVGEYFEERVFHAATASSLRIPSPSNHRRRTRCRRSPSPATRWTGRGDGRSSARSATTSGVPASSTS